MYSRELVNDIAYKYIPQKLKDFYIADFCYCGNTANPQPFKNVIGKELLTFGNYVEEVMDGFLKGSKGDVSAQIRAALKNVSTRKKALSKYLLQQMEGLSLTNPLNPLYIQNLNDPITDIESTLDYYKKAYDNWRESGAFFIDAPFYNYASRTSIKNLYKLDITISICNYISKELRGSLNNFFVPLSNKHINKPLFSPTSYSIHLQEISTDIYGYGKYDENNNLIMTIAYSNSSPNEVKKVLSSNEKKVLSYLPSTITNIREFEKTGVFDVSENELANLFVTTAGISSREKIDTIISNLVGWFYYKNGLGYHYIDLSIPYLDKYGHRRYKLTANELTKKAIIEHDYISVKKEEYEQLENSLSVILVHFFKSEQLFRYPFTEYKDGYIDYSYSTFLNNVNFHHSNTKNTNINLILESLKEFKEKMIIIDDFQYHNGDIRIKYINPSEDELFDNNSLIEFHRKNF